MNEHPKRQLPLDLARLLQADVPPPARRQALRWLAAAGVTTTLLPGLLACGGGDPASAEEVATSAETGSSSATGTDGQTCSSIPTETAGPYPADGSSASGQRLNALALSGIVRQDIRSSIAGASGTAEGVPLTVTLTLVNSASSCSALAGMAVYLWHCTREGGYSLYSSGVTGENFLRGVQVSDANGQVSFTTIFPGCYSGRWPHIHFEIYPSLDAATDSSAVSDYSRVSQLALPAVVCQQVYGTAQGYASSVSNLASISLDSDNVFGDDGAALQLATVSGSVSGGFSAALTVGVPV